MAVTLPYPSMDFTPLDILTANELDQMVANIEFLATKSYETPSSVNLTDFMTLNAGFSFNTSYSYVFKWGKLIVARLELIATTPYSTSNSIPGVINNDYKGNGIWCYGAFFGDAYNVREYGYSYVNFGAGTSSLYLNTSGQSSVTGLTRGRVFMVYFTK